ncbi:hypothetical protein [Burkholderia sp. 8Y]|uniref:hypothetical protein n=1 Tax=Burkholderia sp. 8Y TaxID=2653133 RepID=UPI00135A2859|nr:hypothetical protein [Burkholderia sp. 8Y]
MNRRLIPGMLVTLILRAPVSPLADSRLPADMSRLGDAWGAVEQMDVPGAGFGAQHAGAAHRGYVAGMPMRFSGTQLPFRFATSPTLQPSEW